MCFFSFAAQEVHKNSRDPFKACEKLGPQGSGAATARLGVVFAGKSPLNTVTVKVASIFRVVVSKALEDKTGVKRGVLLIGNFRGGKWAEYLPAVVISVHLARLTVRNPDCFAFFFPDSGKCCCLTVANLLILHFTVPKMGKITLFFPKLFWLCQSKVLQKRY